MCCIQHSLLSYMIIINNNKGAMKGGSLVKLILLDKTRKKYVLGHLGYFWLVMVRVLAEAFQVFMMFWWFQGYSLSVSVRKKAGRKEQGVKRKRMKEQWGVDWVWAHSSTSRDPAALCFQQLCSRMEVAPFNASVTKVWCEVQGVNTGNIWPEPGL